MSDLERQHDAAPHDAEPQKAARPAQAEHDEHARHAHAHAPDAETTANADNLSREQLTHPANAARVAGLLGHLQRSHGNAYVQRFVADVSVHEPGESERVESERAGEGASRPLDSATKSRMESAFGEDFGDVRLHTGADAGRAADQLGARAFTRGRDIYFNSGEYDPSTRDGQELLAHELAHVVQQGGGASVQQANATGRAGDAFEQEADHAASTVLSGQPARVPRRSAAPALQCQTPSKGRKQKKSGAGTYQYYFDDALLELYAGDAGLITIMSGTTPSAHYVRLNIPPLGVSFEFRGRSGVEVSVHTSSTSIEVLIEVPKQQKHRPTIGMRFSTGGDDFFIYDVTIHFSGRRPSAHP